MSQKVHKVSKSKYMSVTEKTNAKQDTAVVLAFDFVQEVVKPLCPLLKSLAVEKLIFQSDQICLQELKHIDLNLIYSSHFPELEPVSLQ